MAHPITILIVDTDSYFAHGLRFSIQMLFQSYHRDVRLLEIGQMPEHVDIIFLGNSTTCPPWLYHLRQQQCHPLVFFIKEREYQSNSLRQHTECGAGVLYRYQDLQALDNLLSKALLLYEFPNSSLRHCHCISQLTPREKDILRCLAGGLGNHEIALNLLISEKTVNAHKQNVMRKLNFKRNYELHHWLQQGGIQKLDHQQALKYPESQEAKKR